MSVSSADATDSDALLGPSVILPRIQLTVAASPTQHRSSSDRPSRQQQQREGVSPAMAVDLIELASSAEDVSLCSSDYKSCDEDGGQHQHRRNGAPASRGMLNIDGDEEEEDEEDDDCCLPDEPFAVSVRGLHGSSSAAQLSVSSSTGSDPATPTCRICHLSGGDGDTLISPCRCAGTMQHIHSACLMKWLEVSSRKSKRPPSCELCLYQYHRHKKFRVQHWQFPQCSTRDKILHTLFFLSLVTMVAAATVTILCFKHDKGMGVGSLAGAGGGGATAVVGGGRGGGSVAGAAGTALDRNRLTHSEVVTLVCGVLFFVAFFLAMYVEVKARSTIYKLVVDFLYLNQQWYIDEYDKKMDVQSVAV